MLNIILHTSWFLAARIWKFSFGKNFKMMGDYEINVEILPTLIEDWSFKTLEEYKNKHFTSTIKKKNLLWYNW